MKIVEGLHQTVPHGWRGLVVNTVFATSGKEISLLHLFGPDTFSNPHHPEELVDIVTGVPEKTTEDDQHVVDFVLSHDGVADLFSGCLLYTSPSPRDGLLSRMPSSA